MSEEKQEWIKCSINRVGFVDDALQLHVTQVDEVTQKWGGYVTFRSNIDRLLALALPAFNMNRSVSLLVGPPDPNASNHREGFAIIINTY